MPRTPSPTQPSPPATAWQAPEAGAFTGTTTDEAAAAGTRAVIWSIVGICTCCFPLSIVGLVYGLRSRSMAKAQNTSTPGTAIVALLLGGLWGVLMVIGIVAFAIDQHNLSSRKDELRALVAEPAKAATLKTETACHLAELHVLEYGYGGKSGLVMDDFECRGVVAQSDGKAEIGDVSFNAGSGNAIHAKVCFHKASSWVANSIRQSSECSDPKEQEPDLDRE